MSAQFNTWAPTLRENEEPTLSLLVRCGESQPDRRKYEFYLGETLESLIKENPKQARKVIEELSAPDSPDLSFLLGQFESQEWALQIMLSPQMAMLMHRIDWQKTSPVQKRSAESLPSLMDILQMLP